jgi:glycosyltransferase involved in cell wall biosynthesis
MINSLPVISVITVVYNGEKHLENTIKSVIDQSYNNIQYIIIDGGSTDNSLNIIQKYKDKINYWISEPDNGIYYAMNKGIDAVKGNWVNFMNVGDTFFDNNVLSELFLSFDYSDTDIIYGNVLLNLDIGLSVRRPKPIKNIVKGMVFSHQSCFVRSELIKMTKFDTSYSISSDYNMLYNFYISYKRFRYIDRNIAIYDAKDGLSLLNQDIWMKEDAKVRGELNSLKFKIMFLQSKIERFFVKVIKFILPNELISKIRKKRFSIK